MDEPNWEFGRSKLGVWTNQTHRQKYSARIYNKTAKRFAVLFLCLPLRRITTNVTWNGNIDYNTATGAEAVIKVESAWLVNDGMGKE